MQNQQHWNCESHRKDIILCACKCQETAEQRKRKQNNNKKKNITHKKLHCIVKITDFNFQSTDLQAKSRE